MTPEQEQRMLDCLERIAYALEDLHNCVVETTDGRSYLRIIRGERE